jgi:formate dehydrogenase major subunit
VSDATTRALFESAWNVSIDPEPGLRIPNMFEAALDGSFKGIYIQGEDIVQSDPNTQHVKPPGADGMRGGAGHLPQRNRQVRPCVLPGSSFLEKDGTFTNAERRISRVRKVMPPLAGKADWEATLALADALGYPMHYSHPSEIMDEIARLTPSFHGVSYECSNEGQHPVALQRGRAEGTPTMHVGGFVRGKGASCSRPTCRPPRRSPAASRCS